MTKTFKIGDTVTMTRMPTNEDWEAIGEIEIPGHIMDNPNVVTGVGSAADCVSFVNTGYYPACCFKLLTDHEQAQVGDIIEIIDNNLADWIDKGDQYTVLSVGDPDAHNGTDYLKLNTERNRDYYWACKPHNYRIIQRQAGEPTFDKEALLKQQQKLKQESLLLAAKEKYPPGTKFTNKQGSISVISDTPEYTHSSSKDGIYARTITGKLVYIYYEGKWYDIVKEDTSLLERAKRDYPKGTKFRSAYSGEQFISTGQFDDEKVGIATGGKYVYIKATDKWAEIVKEEPIVTSTPRARLKAGDRIYIKNCAEGTASKYRNSVVKVAFDPYYYGDGSYHITVTHDPKVGFLLNTHEWEHDTTPTTEEEHMFKVGDIVVGLPSANTKYNVTKEGWKGVITEIHNKLYMTVRGIKERGIYTVKKDHFEVADSYTEEELFYPKLKTNTNGTESNKQSVKLQGTHLKIREGNSIRGIGLKGSGSKIKLGGDYSHY